MDTLFDVNAVSGSSYDQMIPYDPCQPYVTNTLKNTQKTAFISLDDELLPIQMPMYH